MTGFASGLFSGGFYCYDIPGALQSQIVSDMEVSVAKYAQLYTWYSWPNSITAACGGFVIDKYLGIRKGAIACAIIQLAGQLIISFGAFTKIFQLMVFGRFM